MENEKYKYTQEELIKVLTDVRDIVHRILQVVSEGYAKISEVQIVGVSPIMIMGHAFNLFGTAIMKLEHFRDLLTMIINGEYIEDLKNELDEGRGEK